MTKIPFLPTALPERRALLDDTSEHWLSYAELVAQAEAWQNQLEQEKSLVFLYLRNSSACVAAFLGALAASHAVALLDADLPPASKATLEDIYAPDCILLGEEAECTVVHQSTPTRPLHPDLAVLLSTSGSTGGPKFVRLTLENMLSNARAIAQVLNIKSEDVAGAHLQLHYSYGLSVLTSHLVQGASVALTQRSFMDRAFWPFMRSAQVSHFPGVPFHFDMMRRLGFTRLDLKNLRCLTQAGGHMVRSAREQAHAYMSEQGGTFHVMYGQTEAAPRITTLAHNDFLTHADTVGPALPGGRLSIRNEDGQELPTGQEGLVYYNGANVMMGYAQGRSDLALGDVQGDELATGDIGHLDDAGRLTITGRAKRFGKIYGLRVNLDEIEALVRTHWSEAAVIQKGDQVKVYLAPEANADMVLTLKGAFAERFTLPATSYKFLTLDSIPHTERGKPDYRALEAL